MESRNTKSSAAGESAQRRGILRWGERNAARYRHWATLLAAFGYRRMVCDVVESLPAEGRLIDLGCGSGEALRIVLGKRPGISAAAADLSAAFLREAGRAHPGALRVACDVGLTPFRGGSFESIFCFGVLGHLLDAEPAIREIVRIGRRGGAIHIWTRTDGFGSRLVSRLFEASNPGVRFVLHDPERIRFLLRERGIAGLRERRIAGGILWSGRLAGAKG